MSKQKGVSMETVETGLDPPLVWLGAFQGALALWYNWQPLHTPSTCGCGAKFSVEYTLS